MTTLTEIIEQLQAGKKITKIELQSKQIGDEEIKLLTQALENNSTVIEINLNFDQIGAEGARYLAQMLEKNSHITKIGLIGNKIGDEGATYLGEMLEKNSSVKEIDLRSNEIGDHGIKFLARALEKNSSVMEIDFGWNKIDNEKVKYLAQMLEKNSSVKKIGLSNNQIGDEGARIIAEVLKVNTSVIQVDLSTNKIEVDNISAINQLTQRNEDLAIINQEADSFVKAGLYQEAIKSYDEVIGLKPDFAFAYCSKGLVLYVLGEYQEAIKLYDIAIALKPDFVDAYKYAANVLSALDKEEEATKCYNKANELIQERGKLSMKNNQQNYIPPQINDKEITIREIYKLIGKGNARIQEEVEKAILILGKTGAGKSTLTYLLAQQQLKAKLDDTTGNMMVEAVEELGDIKISHNAVSETKIPNKHQSENVVLWDCPGFNDTGGVAQEIANAFYIRRLFETTKELKFVLVISDSSMSNRGVDIVSIVDHFVRLFKDITHLKDSISLVITQALPHKKIDHIKKAIEKVLEQNQTIEANTKQMLEFLLKSVHIFYQPTDEGIIKQEQNILKEINSSTKYVKASANLANVAISKKSVEFAEELFDSTHSNLSNLVNIISKAVTNLANKFVDSKNYTNENIFAKGLNTIKDWVTSSKPDYDNLSFVTNKQKYFLDLDQICSFQEAFDKLLQKNQNNTIVMKQPSLFNNVGNNLQGKQNSDFDNFRDNIVKILKIFQGFNSNKNEVQEIQKYSDLFSQQIEYIKFLKDVCENKQIDLNTFSNSFLGCKALIDKAAANGVKSMTLDKNNDDIAYYKKAIEYLDKYSTTYTECVKTKSEAHYHIGRIYEKKSALDQAVSHYIDATKLDKSSCFVYEKIGDLLLSKKQYSEAIKCFKAVNNSIKVLDCFKELVKLNPDDPKIRVEKGDYLFSIGRGDKANGCYQDAFSLSKDPNFKSTAWLKVANVLQEQHKQAYTFTQKASNKDFYNHNEIKPDEFYQSISQYFIPSQNLFPNLFPNQSLFQNPNQNLFQTHILGNKVDVDITE